MWPMPIRHATDSKQCRKDQRDSRKNRRQTSGLELGGHILVTLRTKQLRHEMSTRR